MLIIEIRKAGKLYNINFQQGTLEEAYKLAKDIATGKATYQDDMKILDLGPSDQYEHIHVFKEELGPVVEDPKDDPVYDEVGEYKEFKGTIQHLGQKITLEGLKYCTQTCAYFLPMSANGIPALELMSGETLYEVTERYIKSNGYDNGYEHRKIVIPPGLLADYEEGAAYLKDYVKEFEAELAVDASELTAQVWPAWNKDSKNE
ncbi:hypothetical protein [Metabacillus fastidiosus]|uniref:hypothetical protein n=1 Tax=Metabacillus fastidiosus TaxID=1458 RepID=UPI003D2D3959